MFDCGATIKQSVGLALQYNGIINNAGVLMFAKNVGRQIHHAETILAAFKGTDRTHIFDRKDGHCCKKIR